MPHTLRETAPPPIHAVAWEPFPEIDLRQLLRMSDDTGMFQHAIFGMPDPNHGYCIDDNARAVIAALHYAQLRGYDERVIPLHRYLTFLAYAFNEERLSFRNFMGYDRRWLEDEGSQDSQGRTVWALGIAVRLAPEEGIRELARNLMHKGLAAVQKFGHIRSWAFALLGLDEYLKQERDDNASQLRDRLAERLFAAHTAHATEEWPWWEDIVTYDNAKLCHALLVSGAAMGRSDMVDAALASLRWLIEVQTAEDEQGGHLSIIGNEGWLRRDGHRAQWDQQPLEAYAMVHACLAAATVTGEGGWADHAWRCFEWFRGRNDLGVSIYNVETGGCCDGLLACGVNNNQGAESTLAYLMSVLELHRHRAARAKRTDVNVKAPATVGYAIVGVSKFAEFCLSAYGGIAGLQPVGAWNRTASKAEALASRTGMQAYPELKALLADPRVQLVHIGTTPATHAELAMQALSAGKHVLVEKPIATDPVDAQRMVQRAAERDLALGVNFMMRYGPLVEPVRQLIADEPLGAMVRGYFVNRAGDAGLPADHWFWDEAQSGGIFVEHAVHAFDLAHHWLGRGQVLSAHRLRRPGSTIVDQVSAEVRYGDQPSINFHHGFLQPTQLDQQDFRLIFERGEVRLVGWIASEIELRGVVTDAEVERLRALFPDAELRTVRELAEGDRKQLRRGRVEAMDREVLLTWRDPTDKQAIYARCLRMLMEDLVRRIRDPRHRTLANAQEATAVLNLAVEATRVAKAITP